MRRRRQLANLCTGQAAEPVVSVQHMTGRVVVKEGRGNPVLSHAIRDGLRDGKQDYEQ